MKVGSKVVCLWTFNHPLYQSYSITPPKKGDIYTIREINTSKLGVGLLLEEIVTPIVKCANGETGELTWDIEGFREVDNTFGKEVCSKIEEQQLELQEV